MTRLALSLCVSCVRNQGDGTCTSFPDGIPQDIFVQMADHRTSRHGEPAYLGDPAASDLLRAWETVTGNERDPVLAGAALTAETDPYYAQSQPRDQRGRWTKGMGMGVPNIATPGDLSPLPTSVAGPEAALLAGGYAEIDPGHLDDMLRDLPNHPSVNLEKLQVTGAANRRMYRDHAREIPREKMPQLPENVEGLSEFRKALDGTKAVMEEVDPRTLRPTQNQLDSVKVGMIYDAIKTGGYRKDSVLFCSRDGEILDGHHRWGAAAAAVATGSDIKVRVMRVDTDIDTLLGIANSVSLERKAMGASFALRKMHSFDEDQPTEPPPNEYEPWFWWDGQWYWVNTDGGDEVPTRLTLDADDEITEEES